jgi:hypothetical protein
MVQVVIHLDTPFQVLDHPCLYSFVIATGPGLLSREQCLRSTILDFLFCKTRITAGIVAYIQPSPSSEAQIPVCRIETI